MIYIGDKQLKKCSLGDEEIKKVYLGDALVFKAKKPSRLPEGYTEVEYIQSSGGACIDLKKKPSANFKLTMDVEPLSANTTKTGKYFFYSYYRKSGTTDTHYYCYCLLSTANKITGVIGAWTQISGQTVNSDGSPRRMTVGVDYPSKIIFADGLSWKSSSITTNTNMTTMRLLNYSLTTSNYGLDAKLYSCQTYKSTVLDGDFVPCINPSGVAGLYDLVGGEFYGNSGTGTLTAGPAV